MKSVKEWFSASELAGLSGMPQHPTNVTRKAKSADWKRRQISGTKGVSFEYHLSSLPPETQEVLSQTSDFQLWLSDSSDFRENGLEVISDLANELKKAKSIPDRLKLLSSSIKGLKSYLNQEVISTEDLVEIGKEYGLNPAWILTGKGSIASEQDDIEDSNSNERLLALLENDDVALEELDHRGKEFLCDFKDLKERIDSSLTQLRPDERDLITMLFMESDLDIKFIESLVEKLSPRNDDILSEFALIPGYRIQVSAGNGSLNNDALQPVRHLAFRRKWLKYKGFNESDLTVVWAKGDSMHPTINDNDTLIVHLGRKEPKDGYIYVFRNGEDLFVKRYQSALGLWRLISDNSVYPPLDIPKEEQHQFEVIGQVVHVAKDIAD